MTNEAGTAVTAATLEFDSPHLRAALVALASEPARYDELGFGLIAMDLAGVVTAYNRVEARFAGVAPERAIGLTFFVDVAPCTNNYLVAGRYDEESLLDETINYVFAVKMRPTAVRLRMLKEEHAGVQFLAVKW